MQCRSYTETDFYCFWSLFSGRRVLTQNDAVRSLQLASAEIRSCQISNRSAAVTRIKCLEPLSGHQSSWAVSGATFDHYNRWFKSCCKNGCVSALCALCYPGAILATSRRTIKDTSTSPKINIAK